MEKLLRLLKASRTGRGKKLFLQAYVVMSLVRLGLLLLPFRRLQNLVLNSRKLTWLAFTPAQVTVNRIAQSVARSGRYQPGKPMCLARALTAAILMNIYGFPHQIQIGVAKSENGKIEAHAWVKSGGRTIVGDLPDLSRYVAMSSQAEGLII